LPHWPRYAIALVLMAVSAAGMAASAYLIGTMTNEAYVARNSRHRHRRIITMVIFTSRDSRPMARR